MIKSKKQLKNKRLITIQEALRRYLNNAVPSFDSVAHFCRWHKLRYEPIRRFLRGDVYLQNWACLQTLDKFKLDGPYEAYRKIISDYYETFIYSAETKKQLERAEKNIKKINE